MKYIDAEKLKAEIDNLESFSCISEVQDGFYSAISRINDIIDSLQQEQPDLPCIEASGIPGKDYIPVEWVDACEKYGKWKIVKQEQPETDFEEEMDKFFEEMPVLEHENIFEETYQMIARHFYELGKKSKEPVIEDLEVREQIEELANDWHHKGFASDEDCPLCMQDLMDILWHFYELGIKTKKGK